MEKLYIYAIKETQRGALPSVHTDQSQWVKYNRNALIKLVQQKYEVYIAGLGHTVRNNPGGFWTCFNCATGKPSVPSSDSPEERCSLFGKYFHFVFTKATSPAACNDIDMSTSISTPVFQLYNYICRKCT